MLLHASIRTETNLNLEWLSFVAITKLLAYLCWGLAKQTCLNQCMLQFLKKKMRTKIGLSFWDIIFQKTSFYLYIYLVFLLIIINFSNIWKTETRKYLSIYIFFKFKTFEFRMKTHLWCFSLKIQDTLLLLV